jgi:hypothetical protein
MLLLSKTCSAFGVNLSIGILDGGALLVPGQVIDRMLLSAEGTPGR